MDDTITAARCGCCAHCLSPPLFSDRWGLIERDTFPAYVRFLENESKSRNLIGKPIGRRVGRFLLLARAGQLAVGFITRWRLRVNAQPTLGRQARRASPSASLRDNVPLQIDLTRPPTRAGMGFIAMNDHRAWTRPDHKTFAVTISLPNARSYMTNAQLVTVTSGAPGGQPSCVSVKLSPMSRDQARAALMSVTAAWGVDPETVEAWYKRPRSARMGHAYSTRVFTAQPVSFVLPELQVTHYVRTDQYVIDALFTWSISAAPPLRNHQE